VKLTSTRKSSSRWYLASHWRSFGSTFTLRREYLRKAQNFSRPYSWPVDKCTETLSTTSVTNNIQNVPELNSSLPAIYWDSRIEPINKKASMRLVHNTSIIAPPCSTQNQNQHLNQERDQKHVCPNNLEKSEGMLHHKIFKHMDAIIFCAIADHT